MNTVDIQPTLSPDPLRERRPGEPWLDWAMALYAHTLAELELSEAAWAAHFGVPHPGAGYTKALEAQKRRLGSEIEDARAAVPHADKVRRQLWHDIFVTAVEGGIGHWCAIRTYRWSKTAGGEAHVVDLDGFQAVIAVEPDAGGVRVIDARVIARGIRLLVAGKATYGGQPIGEDEHLCVLARALSGPEADEVDFDAGDADAIVQIGLFGNVRYA